MDRGPNQYTNIAVLLKVAKENSDGFILYKIMPAASSLIGGGQSVLTALRCYLETAHAKRNGRRRRRVGGGEAFQPQLLGPIDLRWKLLTSKLEVLSIQIKIFFCRGLGMEE